MTMSRFYGERRSRRPGPLRVAVIGTRGLPATYGGVERHVEEIGSRLADLGHDITVFCRARYAEPTVDAHRGMRLVHLPTVASKNFEAIAHSAYASCKTLRGEFDVVAYHAVGPGLTAPVSRYVGRVPVVQTIHGLDADRAKWGRVARTALGLGTWMSAHVPCETIVVSEALEQHYRDRYNRSTWHIPNGVDAVCPPAPGSVLARFGLSPGAYVLFVGRLVPEKAPDRLMRAFRRATPGGMKLALVGGSSFTDTFVAGLHDLAADDDRIVMPGFIYGRELHELYAHAALFVLPSDLEGLPLTLLEAASFGVPVLASNIAPHVQVLVSDGAGRRLVQAGSEDALVTSLRFLLDPQHLPVERTGALQLRSEVLRRYSWEEATRATEALYRTVSGVGPNIRPHPIPAPRAVAPMDMIIDLRDGTTPRAISPSHCAAGGDSTDSTQPDAPMIR